MLGFKWISAYPPNYLCWQAHRLSIKLRAAEDRIAQLHEEVEHLQDRANRAEQWLETIKREIEDNLIASMEANRREPLAVR